MFHKDVPFYVYDNGWFVSGGAVREGFHDLIERIDELGGVDRPIMDLIEQIRDTILDKEVFLGKHEKFDVET